MGGTLPQCFAIYFTAPPVNHIHSSLLDLSVVLTVDSTYQPIAVDSLKVTIVLLGFDVPA